MYDSNLDFVFENPTKVIFGNGAASKVAREVRERNGNHVLLVTDKFLKDSEMVHKLTAGLGSKLAGIFADIEPDTGTHTVNKGVQYAWEIGVDCIVTVGGGSSMDTSKGIAIVLTLGVK